VKVLLTGCSAPQSSHSLNGRLPTFSGLIRNALSYAGHDITWEHPSISMTEEFLSQFDVVIVGLSSPTSMSAYRLYGALSVIERARKFTNVRYLIDAPEPHKLWAGIRALVNSPEDLIKDFYSKRPEYQQVSESKEFSRLHSVLVDLYENSWERTIVPAFPWSTKTHITEYIPNILEDSIELVCLDSVLLTAIPDGLYMKSEADYWTVNQETPWTKKLQKTLINNVEPMNDSKWNNNSAVLVKLNKSIGSIITTYKNGDPWWSVNLSQSLFVNTPVVTDWRHTAYLGESWSILAHQIEELSMNERASLAINQREQYVKSIPNFSDSITGVLSAVFNDSYSKI